MISGEAVVVELRQFGAEDAYGNPVESWAAPQTVEDVLVGDGGVDERTEDGRPYALAYDRTFHFPRSWASDLRGAHVTHGGRTYEVVDAVGYTDANIAPGIRWNLVAKAVVVDG